MQSLSDFSIRGSRGRRQEACIQNLLLPSPKPQVLSSREANCFSTKIDIQCCPRQIIYSQPLHRISSFLVPLIVWCRLYFSWLHRLGGIWAASLDHTHVSEDKERKHWGLRRSYSSCTEVLLSLTPVSSFPVWSPTIWPHCTRVRKLRMTSKWKKLGFHVHCSMKYTYAVFSMQLK